MNIAGFGAPHLLNQKLNGGDEVFDPEMDDLAENDAPSKAVVTHQSPETWTLLDPHSAQDPKLKIMMDILKKHHDQMAEMNAEIVAGKHTLAQMQNGFAKEKDSLNLKLLDQSKEIDGLTKTLNEVSLPQAREEWIKNNIDFAAVYIAGSGLGAAAGIYGFGAMAAIGLTGVSPLAPMIIGANRGVSFTRSLLENNLREILKKHEEQYLIQNPLASKKDAFEYAKGVIELANKNSKTEDPDSWGGVSY